MDTIAIEFCEARFGDKLFAQGVNAVPRELCGPNFPDGSLPIFETADKVYVAHHNGDLVGCICLTRYQGCPDDPQNMEGWASCWYVKESYRGRGYGIRLLQLVIEYARKHPKLYGRHIFAENAGDFLKKVNGAANRVFVDYERTIQKPDGSTSDIYWILLS